MNNSREELTAMDAATPFFVSADGYVRLYGAPWDQVLRGRKDVARCLLGRHRRVMWGQIFGRPRERCSCGAVRGGEGAWTGGDARRRVRPPVDQEFEYEGLLSFQRFLDSFDGGG